MYLYLKKEKINSFDGIINFNSQKNKKGLLFTGHLKLNINNILNTGEDFKISWIANGEERQSFSTYLKLPYIFNTPITPEIEFKIHKQDSTFLNNSTKLNLNYTLKRNLTIGLHYNSINSENTTNNTDDNQLISLKSSFIGLNLAYETHKEHPFFISIQPATGKRKTTNTTLNQFKLTSKTNFTYNINKRNVLNLSNTTGILQSNNLVTNELFRIGGANSIRGFSEESIFASQFTFFNTEYRYKTSLKSYFFSITDIGFTKELTINDTYTSLGLGYKLTNKNTSLKTSLVVGKNSSSSFNLNNPQLIIQLVSFF